jgi:hypothetical protein
MSKRLCKVCGKTPLHRDNTSGICRACKKAGAKPAAAAKHGGKRMGLTLERTDKEPKKPFVGLNLLVVQAVQELRDAASVANIAAHMRRAPAFRDSTQDPARAARWHTWHLVKHGYLRRRKGTA